MPANARAAINLRVPESVRDLIDRAARSHSKSRSEFMIDAARRAAEEALLDQTLVLIDADAFAHYQAVLDQPPSSAGYSTLMNAPKPWMR